MATTHTKHLIDPELIPLLDMLPRLKPTRESLPQIRAIFNEMTAQMLAALPESPDISVSEHHIPGPQGAPDVRVLVSLPKNASPPTPALLWMHGGGYLWDNADRAYPLVKGMIAATGCAAVAVDYRLAPETPHPGPVEDCYAALKWLHTHAKELGVDASRIAIGGDSAGTGLTAALALLARDRGEVPLIFQLLMFPMLDDRTTTMTDLHPYTGEYVWTVDDNRFAWTAYLGQESGGANISPDAAPDRAERLEGLPPAFIGVGTLDLFLEEDLEYARRLMRAGAPTELHVYPGAFHMFSLAENARVAQAFTRDYLNALTRTFERNQVKEKKKMKVVRFAHYGEPAKVLTVQVLPLPEPGAGEVRVRILASPVNPSDLLFVRGHYAGVQPHFPSRVGFEGVGIVDALGPNVNHPVPGQRVAIINAESGNWAEYAVVPASVLLPVPDDLPEEQVASFVINPATAILMLRHVLAVPRGEWLLQSAAGSELGRMIIRLAKHDGIRTINVVRRREAVAALERLGADVVIVSTEGPIDEQVRKMVGPQGVKYAIDPVVGETGTQMYQALHEEGRMLVYGSLTGEPTRVGADPRFILAGRRILEVFWLGYWLPRLDEAAQRQLVQDIVSLQREGILTTSAACRFLLDEIGLAVTQAERVGRQGKVLLVPEQH